MYREVYDEVVRWSDAVRRRDRLRLQQTAIQAELSGLQQQLEQLIEGLGKEEHDVARLEGASLTRLLLSAMGRAQARLDKERREALEARLRVEAKRAEVELLQIEFARIDGELALLADVDKQYSSALNDKAARILRARTAASDRLRELVREVTEAAGLLREVDEAIAAGKWAERHLTEAARAIKALQEEADAATATMIATLVVTVMMSTEMPAAHRLEENLKHAHGWIRRYARELNDIPGWRQAAQGIASHGNLLLSFVNIVAGGDTEAARASRNAVTTALSHVRRLQARLVAARPELAARRDNAMLRYRAEVERA